MAALKAGKWMTSLLRNLLLVISLLTASLPAFSQSTNPYNHELQELRSSIDSASYLEKLARLDRIFHLRDYVDDPASVSRIFEEIKKQEVEESGDIIHTEAEAYLSDIGALLGQSPRPQARH